MSLTQCRPDEFACPYCGGCNHLPNPGKSLNIPIPSTNVPLSIPDPIEIVGSHMPIRCSFCRRRYSLVRIAQNRVEEFIKNFDFTGNVASELKHYKISTNMIINNLLGITIPSDYESLQAEVIDKIRNIFKRLKPKHFKDIKEYERRRTIRSIHIVFRGPANRPFFLSCKVDRHENSEFRVCFRLDPVVKEVKDSG